MQDMSINAAETFRHNVSELLREQDRTITEMAEALGMSRPSLSHVLAGRGTVTLPRAQRIADFLEVSLAELVTEKKFAKTT